MDSAKYQIAVVEDEKDLSDLLKIHLATVPAEVQLFSDGLEAYDALELHLPDLLILDLNLPGMSGLDICRALRGQGVEIPILMLTARASELDRVVGLEFGADDYLVKPFGVLELVARARALLRRIGRAPVAGPDNAGVTDRSESALLNTGAQSEIVLGELRLNRHRRAVSFCNEAVPLKPREFDLLWFFASNPGRVFTRAELLASVWGYEHEGYNHTVNTHINRLRHKLGDSRANPHVIHTVWGVGYRLDPSPRRSPGADDASSS
ncbi:MAG: response regulator transcription factor [Burkholderiaceae bacterium]